MKIRMSMGELMGYTSAVALVIVLGSEIWQNYKASKDAPSQQELTTQLYDAANTDRQDGTSVEELETMLVRGLGYGGPFYPDTSMIVSEARNSENGPIPTPIYDVAGDQVIVCGDAAREYLGIK
jgi:hypothetical protein